MTLNKKHVNINNSGYLKKLHKTIDYKKENSEKKNITSKFNTINITIILKLTDNKLN